MLVEHVLANMLSGMCAPLPTHCTKSLRGIMRGVEHARAVKLQAFECALVV
jgi:hypothetical protein